MSVSDEKEGIDEVTAGRLQREMDRLLAEIDPTKIAEAEIEMMRAVTEVTLKFRKIGSAVHVSTQNVDDIDKVSVSQSKAVRRNIDKY